MPTTNRASHNSERQACHDARQPGGLQSGSACLPAKTLHFRSASYENELCSTWKHSQIDRARGREPRSRGFRGQAGRNPKIRLRVLDGVLLIRIKNIADCFSLSVLFLPDHHMLAGCATSPVPIWSTFLRDAHPATSETVIRCQCQAVALGTRPQSHLSEFPCSFSLVEK